MLNSVKFSYLAGPDEADCILHVAGWWRQADRHELRRLQLMRHSSSRCAACRLTMPTTPENCTPSLSSWTGRLPMRSSCCRSESTRPIGVNLDAAIAKLLDMADWQLHTVPAHCCL